MPPKTASVFATVTLPDVDKEENVGELVLFTFWFIAPRYVHWVFVITTELMLAICVSSADVTPCKVAELDKFSAYPMVMIPVALSTDIEFVVPSLRFNAVEADVISNSGADNATVFGLRLIEFAVVDPPVTDKPPLDPEIEPVPVKNEAAVTLPEKDADDPLNVVPVIVPEKAPFVADRAEVSVRAPAPVNAAATEVPPYHLKPDKEVDVENQIFEDSIPNAKSTAVVEMLGYTTTRVPALRVVNAGGA